MPDSHYIYQYSKALGIQGLLFHWQYCLHRLYCIRVWSKIMI